MVLLFKSSRTMVNFISNHANSASLYQIGETSSIRKWACLWTVSLSWMFLLNFLHSETPVRTWLALSNQFSTRQDHESYQRPLLSRQVPDTCLMRMIDPWHQYQTLIVCDCNIYAFTVVQLQRIPLLKKARFICIQDAHVANLELQFISNGRGPGKARIIHQEVPTDESPPPLTGGKGPITEGVTASNRFRSGKKGLCPKSKYQSHLIRFYI